METIPFKIALKNQISRSKVNKRFEWPLQGALKPLKKENEEDYKR
jgi:hypothetical protein